MSERQERDWTDMTPGDFDREAPLRLNVGSGAVVVPAEPDAYGTPALFGQQRPDRPARPRRPQGPSAPAVQEQLF